MLVDRLSKVASWEARGCFICSSAFRSSRSRALERFLYFAQRAATTPTSSAQARGARRGRNLESRGRSGSSKSASRRSVVLRDALDGRTAAPEAVADAIESARSPDRHKSWSVASRTCWAPREQRALHRAARSGLGVIEACHQLGRRAKTKRPWAT